MALKGQVPYTKSVKAKVIDTDLEQSYTNERNESRILKNCVIEADEGKAVLCVVYDQTKFPRFREGSSVILRNVIKKPDEVAVTSNTKVFPCAEVVPEHIVNQAKKSSAPPPAPTKTVSEALNSPPNERGFQ